MLMQETGVDTIKQRKKKIEKKRDFFIIYSKDKKKYKQDVRSKI